MSDVAQRGDWREGWRTLPNLLPPAAIVAHASLGTEDPAWEEKRSASYPDRLVLYALALEDELRAAFPQAGIRPGMRVLDAACGPGVVGRFLVEAGAREVVGVDIEPAMLELARRFPMPPGAESRLSFREADLTKPLPFPDATFDAVWLGDAWFPEKPEVLTELARVTRPGGSLILKIGGTGVSRTYAWDRDLEARIQLAQQRGQAGKNWARRTGLHDVGMYGRLKTAGPWAGFEMWSVLVERFAPVPAVYEEYIRQGFGLFYGGFIKNAAEPQDWEAVSLLYDPTSPDYLFKRADGHFLQTLTFARCILPG